jgi:hypothetical protein
MGLSRTGLVVFACLLFAFGCDKSDNKKGQNPSGINGDSGSSATGDDSGSSRTAGGISGTPAGGGISGTPAGGRTPLIPGGGGGPITPGGGGGPIIPGGGQTPLIADSEVPQGRWKVISVDSGDGILAGDHPWRIESLLISGDRYIVTRRDGTKEQGGFKITSISKPATASFDNWGREKETRFAAYELSGALILRVCMFTDSGASPTDSIVPPGIPPQLREAYLRRAATQPSLRAPSTRPTKSGYLNSAPKEVKVPDRFDRSIILYTFERER